MNFMNAINTLTASSLIVFATTIATSIFRESQSLEISLAFGLIASAIALPFIRAFFISNMENIERYCDRNESRHLISLALGNRFTSRTRDEK